MKKWFFVLSVLVSATSYADCDSSGKCVWDCSPDENNPTCRATFENGTLTISGTGEMKDYTYHSDYDFSVRKPDTKDGYFLMTNAPWNDEFGHLNQITNLVVEEGITKIGNSTLTHAVNLKSVSLPEGLEAIGTHAFYLTGLTQVELPSTLQTIGNITGSGGGSFQYTNLTSIELPEGLKTISSSVFRSTPLESVVIPDSVEKIGNRAFLNTPNLQSIIIGDGVVSIDAEAFAGISAYIYCKDTAERSCKELIGENNSDAFKKLKVYSIDGNGKIRIGDKVYDNLGDLPKYISRRIYTVEEANAVAGRINRVSITYR